MLVVYFRYRNIEASGFGVALHTVLSRRFVSSSIIWLQYMKSATSVFGIEFCIFWNVVWLILEDNGYVT